MIRINNPRRAAGLALTSALAGVLLAGCAGMPAGPVASAGTTATIKADSRAIAKAERNVQAEPRNAAFRAALGAAYMDSGRFASAATTFDDAMKLGDTSPRTVLSLALAQMGQGRMREAASLLNEWEDDIATADIGLALSLAGQPDRGIHLMSNAIRAGDNTPKMRQNLAYAYALAGRWREARLMAAQDVPADKLGDRIQQWAELSAPEAWHHRIATMLDVPAGVRDQGQPAMLALNNASDVEQLVAEATAQVPPAPPVRGELPALASAAATPAHGSAAAPVREQAGAELPPLRPAVQASAAPVAPPAPPRLRSAGFEAAFAAPAPTPPVVAAAARDGGQRATGPAAKIDPVHAAPAVARTTLAAPGSHRVQLGSFATEQGARRAWNIYVKQHPELAGHQMVISEAVVSGKRFWRVAAAGFGPRDSSAMCGKVKSRGHGCIAYAQGRPLPGAVDTPIRMARR